MKNVMSNQNWLTKRQRKLIELTPVHAHPIPPTRPHELMYRAHKLSAWRPVKIRNSLSQKNPSYMFKVHKSWFDRRKNKWNKKD